MRAITLAAKMLAQITKEQFDAADGDGEMDYKDTAAVMSSAYSRMADDMAFNWLIHLPFECMPPDGGSCPRAFWAWDDVVFIKAAAAAFSKKNRKWRKAVKLQWKL